MPEFSVLIGKTQYESGRLTVIAANADEARELAEVDAFDAAFRIDDCEIEILEVTPLTDLVEKERA